MKQENRKAFFSHLPISVYFTKFNIPPRQKKIAWEGILLKLHLYELCDKKMNLGPKNENWDESCFDIILKK